MVAHTLGDEVTIFRLRSVEPNVFGGAREGALHHAGEAAVLLAYHRIAVVRGENDDVDGRRVISHAYGAWFGSVLSIVKRDYGREYARQHAMQHERRVPVQRTFEWTVFYVTDQKCRQKCKKTRQYEQQ